jgi:competence protein ComEC
VFSKKPTSVGVISIASVGMGVATLLGDEDRGKFPARPSLPLLLPVAFVAWMGIVIAEESEWRWACGMDATSVMAFMLLLLVIGAVVTFVLQRHRPHLMPLPIILTCAFAMGLACGGLYWSEWKRQVDMLDTSGGVERVYEVISDPTQGSYGLTSEAYLMYVDGRTCVVKVRWASDQEPLAIGQRFKAYGAPATPDLAEGDGADAARWMHRNGIVASVSVRGIEEVGWGDGVLGTVGRVRLAALGRIAVIPGDGGALTSAVVLGDRTRIDDTEVEEDFAVCGLAHLVAVSGSHLVVVSALVFWMLSSLRCSRWLRTFFLIMLLAAYTVLTGLQDSAVRALIMTTVGMAAPLLGRRRDAASALCSCVIVLSALTPTCAFSLGFSLSVAAVAGLIILSPLLGAWLRAALPTVLHGLVDPLAMTLAAQLTTVPFTAPLFSCISLIAPLSNILCAPLVTIMIALGLPAAIVGLVPLAPFQVVSGVMLDVVAAVGNIAATLASSMAHVPYASIVVDIPQTLLAIICLLPVAVLWTIWPRPRRVVARCVLVFLFALLCVTVLLGQRTTGPEVVMLDVGQGDAILVRDGNATILVDTGPEDGDLRAALARNGVYRLDAVVVTHLHADHYGALASLYGTVPVGKVLLAQGVFDQAAGDALGLDDHSIDASSADSSQTAAQRAQAVLDIARRVSGDEAVGILPGDEIEVGSISIDVIAPSTFTEQGGNADSLILLGSCDVDRNGSVDDTVLLTGDAEGEVMEPLVASGVIGDIDVLKVGHHGSRVSLDGGVAVALAPEVALISCGSGNRYGHPTRECLDAIEAVGASVYRTDLRSDVTVDLRVAGPQVTCATMSGA